MLLLGVRNCVSEDILHVVCVPKRARKGTALSVKKRLDVAENILAVSFEIALHKNPVQPVSAIVLEIFPFYQPWAFFDMFERIQTLVEGFIGFCCEGAVTLVGLSEKRCTMGMCYYLS